MVGVVFMVGWLVCWMVSLYLAAPSRQVRGYFVVLVGWCKGFKSVRVYAEKSWVPGWI
jgi:hypothetical protein